MCGGEGRGGGEEEEGGRGGEGSVTFQCGLYVLCSVSIENRQYSADSMLPPINSYASDDDDDDDDECTYDVPGGIEMEEDEEHNYE